jgi:CDP-glucose 4,6-dehydratase
MPRSINPQFWNDKSVLLTGHTGFKGAWLTLWLHSLGAKVYGYSLAPITNPSLYSLANIKQLLTGEMLANIQDLSSLKSAFNDSNPDIVIHLAAQPLVLKSYEAPLETYLTNAVGTAHVLDCIRLCPTTKAGLVITTDKCYQNDETIWGFREGDPLGGLDPYSSSKACAELITQAYYHSFFKHSNEINCCISSARAGNVIGGGDWSAHRLIPDAIKSFIDGKTITSRHPEATRPWQHVLEPLAGYLLLIESMFDEPVKFSGAWNFGPPSTQNFTVSNILDKLTKLWGDNANWSSISPKPQNHESKMLKLDSTKAFELIEWTPLWSVDQALTATVSWYKDHQLNKDMREITLTQIASYSAALNIKVN